MNEQTYADFIVFIQLPKISERSPQTQIKANGKKNAHSIFRWQRCKSIDSALIFMNDVSDEHYFFVSYIILSPSSSLFLSLYSVALALFCWANASFLLHQPCWYGVKLICNWQRCKGTKKKWIFIYGFHTKIAFVQKSCLGLDTVCLFIRQIWFHEIDILSKWVFLQRQSTCEMSFLFAVN